MTTMCSYRLTKRPAASKSSITCLSRQSPRGAAHIRRRVRAMGFRRHRRQRSEYRRNYWDAEGMRPPELRVGTAMQVAPPPDFYCLSEIGRHRFIRRPRFIVKWQTVAILSCAAVPESPPSRKLRPALRVKYLTVAVCWLLSLFVHFYLPIKPTNWRTMLRLYV